MVVLIKQMTNEEYVAKQGLVCPYCGSVAIFAVGDMGAEADEAWGEVECLSCCRKWRDVFKLVGWVSEE